MKNLYQKSHVNVMLGYGTKNQEESELRLECFWSGEKELLNNHKDIACSEGLCGTAFRCGS